MGGYKGYVEKAKLVQIKHDVKAAEQLLAREYLVKNTSLPDNWVGTNLQNSVNNIYDTRGLVNHDDVEPGNYKLFPKDEIGSKLPGNFHAKDDGKVYYEDDKTTEKELEYSDEEIQDLINEGFIPVANAEELQRINGSGRDENINIIFEEAVWGAGTKWEGQYTGTLGSKYIQVQDIDLSSYEK